MPGLLPLPAKGLLCICGEEVLPCFAADRKLRRTFTLTDASACENLEGLLEDASGGLLRTAPRGLFAKGLKGLSGTSPGYGLCLFAALSGLSGLCDELADSDMC